MGKPSLEQCHSPCDLQSASDCWPARAWQVLWEPLLCPDLLRVSDSQETNSFDCIMDANMSLSHCFMILVF